MSNTEFSTNIENLTNLDDKVNVQFLFGAHGTKEDAKHVSSYVNDADVYAPELPILREQQKPLFHDLAHGDSTAYRELKTMFPPDSFTQELLSAAYFRKVRSKFDIEILDVPRTKEWVDKFNQTKELESFIPYSETIDDTLDSLDKRLKQYAELLSERDDVIVRNIGKYIVKRVTERTIPPNRPLSIFFTIGYLHQGVFEKLRQQGVPTTIAPRSTLELASINSFDAVKETHRKGEKPSRKLLTHALVSALFTPYIVSNSSLARFKAIRRTVDMFSDDEMERISEEALTLKNDSRQAAIIQEMLQTKTGYRSMDDNDVAHFLATDEQV